MYGVSSSSFAPYLGRGCCYVLDNFTREWAVSLYNIFENTIFREAVIDIKSFRYERELWATFSRVSIVGVSCDIYAVATRVIGGFSVRYLRFLTIVASVAVVAYVADEILNKWYPLEERCQQTVTNETPEKIKISLSRSFFGDLQVCYLARIFFNVFLACTTPHSIPHVINVLCQIHIVYTVVQIRWLKLSRKVYFWTNEECVQKLEAVPFVRGGGLSSLFSDDSREVPEERIEDFLKLNGINITF